MTQGAHYPIPTPMARRYRLTVFRLIPPNGANQTTHEEVMAYSAEDAVFQFHLKYESEFSFGVPRPTVQAVEPA